MERDAVEVGYGLVDVYGRGTVPQSARLVLRNWNWASAYPENRSVSTDWMRAFW